MKVDALILILMLSLWCMGGRADDHTGGTTIPAPTDGATAPTPFSARLHWSAVPDAASYTVTLYLVGADGPLLETTGITDTTLRIAVRPGTRYRWNVTAVDADGGALGAPAVSTFHTPTPELREVTDPQVLFAGMHPHARWVNMEPVPEDLAAVLSPWYYKKRFEDSPPPTFEAARATLPDPIWEGHNDAIAMYWYAWKTLFSVWLYAPPATDHHAVSNLVGMPTWAGWGSTMVLDTAFILQFARYGCAAYPFITALDNCYARQHENGYVCRESDNSNWEVSSGWPVNPPLLAWAEWSWYQVTGDTERVRRVFLPLVKQFEWYMLYQRRANGLYWTMGLNEADDSPRNELAHSYLSTTATQALSAEILARMAQLVGRTDMAGCFRDEARRLKDLVNARCWDAEHNLYNDLGKDGRTITRTPSGGLCKHGHIFWPLLAGIATGKRIDGLALQLTDPNAFLRASGIASLSADSEGYNKENGAYWRGSVWPPIQCMVIQGLHAAGREELATQIADRYYGAFLRAYKAKGDITEFLAPDRPEMLGVGTFVGWGGVAPIGVLIEDILGIRPDAVNNRVVWRIRQPERHGIRRLHFGPRTVSLICGASGSGRAPRRISVESDGDFDLWLVAASGTVRRRIYAGETVLTVAARQSVSRAAASR